MNKLKINIQLFASLEDIMAQHTDAFPEGNDFGSRFGGIQSQLQSLGYDVLINNREAAEFVPASRLSEVVSQRDNFKAQFEKANKDLEALKGQAGISEEAQNQINNLIAANTQLLESLKEANINLEIISGADDAINPKDILMFVNKEALKMDKEGKITGGLTEELDRLRTEKPYLFNAKSGGSGSKGGTDGQGAGSGGNEHVTMNAMIRRAAGGSRSF